ncbi:TPA: plasmid mobilization relaxosome protein MobC [Vibrio parahaemolyticus]|nr:plasmid mobilization relaxosome protein MobC [Vibrio parahaemolyticus]
MKKPKRNELIQIRVTEGEKEQIQSNSNGNISSWLRSYGLGNVEQKSVQVKQDPSLIMEVKFIGNNINQIAREINSIRKSGEEVNLISIQARLVSIDESLMKIIKLKL